MTDDDALAILADIAADPRVPPLVRIEAEATKTACAERGISTCRDVISVLIGMLATTDHDRPKLSS